MQFNIIMFWTIYLVRTQNFRKTKISKLMISKRTCAYQGVRNVIFSENFEYVPQGSLSAIIMS